MQKFITTKTTTASVNKLQPNFSRTAKWREIMFGWIFRPKFGVNWTLAYLWWQHSLSQQQYKYNIYKNEVILSNKYTFTIDQELAYAVVQVPADTFSLSRWQHFSAWNNVMAAVLKLWCQIKNLALSVDVYLPEEQSGQISSQSDLKRRSLGLFWRWLPQQSEWVSELFLNGTSAQCRLFSAILLKVEKRYGIQSKSMKENQWATIHEKSQCGTVQMNIS